MAEDQEGWSTDANEAVEISIVQAADGSPKTLSTFHPRFTYPIFGDEERIFGFQGLCINIRFSAHLLRPNIEISYEKKFKEVGDTKATDIEETLTDWTPKIAFEGVENFNAHIQNDDTARDWKPPGDLLETYTSKGRSFELWCGELADPAVQKIIERIQILISFFIEGGTPLDLDDQEWTLARWRVFFIYEKLPETNTPNISSYSIVGYSTSYRFLTYIPFNHRDWPAFDFDLPSLKPIEPSSLPARARISQFLILPPHHSHGHGTHLYNAMVKTFLAEPHCIEITVEDPNEAFDDLRDYCDYNRLLKDGTLAQISLRTDIDPKLSRSRAGVRIPTSKLLDVPLLENIRTKNKMAPRQFARLVEIHLLSKIAPHARQAGTARLTKKGNSIDHDDRAFYYWRLLVKQRIYKKNKDILVQLDRADRVDKIDQTVADQANDYERLLKEMDKIQNADTNGSMGRRVRGKRKMVIDEDEEDDSDATLAASSKRSRSEPLG